MDAFVVTADRVNDPADRVTSVQKCCRAFHNLYPLGAKNIDRFGMIAGLRREGTYADAIRRDLDPIAIEPAYDGPRRPWARRALRDTGFIIENIAEARRCT